MAGKIKAGICFASLICALALLLTSCDFRLKSEREVEKYLEKQYNFLYSTPLRERVSVYRAFVTDYRTPIHLVFSARHLKRGRLIQMCNILSTIFILSSRHLSIILICM